MFNFVILSIFKTTEYLVLALDVQHFRNRIDHDSDRNGTRQARNLHHNDANALGIVE